MASKRRRVQMLANVRSDSECGGVLAADIVKSTLLLADIKDFKAVWMLIIRRFGFPVSGHHYRLLARPLPPAGLPAGALVFAREVVAAYPAGDLGYRRVAPRHSRDAHHSRPL